MWMLVPCPLGTCPLVWMGTGSYLPIADGFSASMASRILSASIRKASGSDPSMHVYTRKVFAIENSESFPMPFRPMGRRWCKGVRYSSFPPSGRFW